MGKDVNDWSFLSGRQGLPEREEYINKINKKPIEKYGGPLVSHAFLKEHLEHVRKKRFADEGYQYVATLTSDGDGGVSLPGHLLGRVGRQSDLRIVDSEIDPHFLLIKGFRTYDIYVRTNPNPEKNPR